MRCYLGADHNGFVYVQPVAAYLKTLGHEVIDVTDGKLDPADDFPVFAARVANAVLADGGEANAVRGILICGSGQGMVMAANRFAGIRAGLGWSLEAARSVRNDEDSNVLSLPSAVFTKRQTWQNIVDVWLKTPFNRAERFVRRNRELDELVA